MSYKPGRPSPHRVPLDTTVELEARIRHTTGARRGGASPASPRLILLLYILNTAVSVSDWPGCCGAPLSLGEALLRARSWGRLAKQDLRLTDPDLSELAMGAATALCPLAEALRAHRFVERARQALAPTDEARVALIGERTRSALSLGHWPIGRRLRREELVVADVCGADGARGRNLLERIKALAVRPRGGERWAAPLELGRSVIENWRITRS